MHTIQQDHRTYTTIFVMHDTQLSFALRHARYATILHASSRTIAQLSFTSFGNLYKLPHYTEGLAPSR